MKYMYFYIYVYVIPKKMDSKARNLMRLYQHKLLMLSVLNERIWWKTNKYYTNPSYTLPTPTRCCSRLGSQYYLDPSKLLKRALYQIENILKYYVLFDLNKTSWPKMIFRMFGRFWLTIWRHYPAFLKFLYIGYYFIFFWQGAWCMLTRTCCLISASFLDAQ